MSDLYDNSDYKQVSLAPFGPIGIISHTANEDFVKEVSRVLSFKRAKRVAEGRTNFDQTPGYSRTDYILVLISALVTTLIGLLPALANDTSVRCFPFFLLSSGISPPVCRRIPVYYLILSATLTSGFLWHTLFSKYNLLHTPDP